MGVTELKTPLPVEIMSKDMPRGMAPNNRRGVCIAWWVDQEWHQWLVCMDDTCEMVWVPMQQIRMQDSWTHRRRHKEVKDG